MPYSRYKAQETHHQRCCMILLHGQVARQMKTGRPSDREPISCDSNKHASCMHSRFAPANSPWVVLSLMLPQDKGTSEANLFGVAVADAKTAWAVGSKGIIKRYNGSAWSVERAPDVGASTLRAVAALNSRKAWAGGGECCCGYCVSLPVICVARCCLCGVLC